MDKACTEKEDDRKMESFANYFAILDHHARTKPGKCAIYYEQEKITYADLNDNINRLGNVLKDIGIRPGDRVILAVPDVPDFFYAFFGAMKCGALPVLLSPDLSRQDYEYILRDSEASVLITVRGSEAATAIMADIRRTLFIDDVAYLQLLAAASAELTPYPKAPEEISSLHYTSGSTGNPKGVPHSQSDMLFCARRYAGDVLKMTENDIVFSVSKLFFAYGLGSSLIFPVYYGASAVLFPAKPLPPDVLRIIDQYHPTLLCSVPTFYGMILRVMTEPVSLPSLRLCVSAGESLPAVVYNTWKEFTGLEIIDGIGSTEALHIFISNRPGNVRPGSSGFLVPGYEAKVVGEDGLPVQSGTQGILHIRGGSTAPYYWNQPEKSRQTMLPEGWLKTGDYYVEEEGCYTYQGRSDDMFKSSGAWVSPIQVEEVLRSHPAVMECAVTSRQWEGLLKPMAYVVVNPDFTGDVKLTKELRKHVLAQLPGYMCPVQINYVQEIPKTRTGKVQRYVLKG